MGRGTDHALFRPDPRARAELARAHGVPDGTTVVLFAGRVDASKRVLVLAEAVRRARARGHPLHLVVAGRGADTDRVARLLGDAATLLDPLPQHHLARVYAGCDIFAFPSRTETAGNVVGEAMACGLPVVLPAGARTTRWLTAPGTDGLLVHEDDADGWARALAHLAGHPRERRAMGERAAAAARDHHRDWTRVLVEDVLPVWRRLPAGRPGRRPAPGPPGRGV
jgi:glycosyltransferase involved in cell wall biosynthesis